MESPDNKTPSRPASGRPSLLSTPAGNTPDKNSQTRMLSSLERDGKTPTPVSARGVPSRRKWGIAALALVAIAAAGALFAFGSFDDASATVAAAPAPRVIPVTSAPAASAAVVTAASSAPASAAIAQIEAATSAPSAEAPAALAQADAASQAHANPLDKLAMNDSESASKPAHAVVADAASHKDKAHAKAVSGAKPHAESVALAKPATHAEAKPAVARKSRKPEDDADTELVAAIIARLDKRGSKPVAPAASATVGQAAPVNIASEVRQCSANGDLIEARRCRNRACDGQWGKVDACPASRAPKTSRSDGADSGKPG